MTETMEQAIESLKPQLDQLPPDPTAICADCPSRSSCTEDPAVAHAGWSPEMFDGFQQVKESGRYIEANKERCDQVMKDSENGLAMVTLGTTKGNPMLAIFQRDLVSSNLLSFWLGYTYAIAHPNSPDPAVLPTPAPPH